jgi:nitrite reductase/ring-hydroxylating ferredoxin subunit
MPETGDSGGDTVPGLLAPPPPREEEHLCASAALAERGIAWVWDVLLYRAPARAFALRFEGKVVAYINRCVHVPTEMDWQPGEFLDIERRWILCSIHGAAYEPADGRCVGGPCGRGRLTVVDVMERDGQVYWYPSRDIRPVLFDEPAASPSQETASPPPAQGNPS